MSVIIMAAINLQKAKIHKLAVIILCVCATFPLYFAVGDLLPLHEKSIAIESYMVSSEHGVGGQIVIVKNTSVFFRVLDS